MGTSASPTIVCEGERRAATALASLNVDSTWPIIDAISLVEWTPHAPSASILIVTPTSWPGIALSSLPSLRDAVLVVSLTSLISAYSAPRSEAMLRALVILSSSNSLPLEKCESD